MSLYDDMIERARRLIANSTTFIAATGAASADDAYARFTYVNDFPNPEGDLLPLPYAVIALPTGMATQNISTGERLEHIKTGSIEVLYLKHVGDATDPYPGKMRDFITQAGSIMEEMQAAFDSHPLSAAETASGTYLAFAGLSTEFDMEREAYRTRENANDYMDVGWRLSLAGGGGDQ
jgi:hypothetical protein